MTVTAYSDYTSLLSSSSGLSNDLLTSWYAAKSAQSTADTSSLTALAAAAQSSSTSSSTQGQSNGQVTPPWDSSVASSTSDLLTKALSGQPFIDESSVKLADPNASDADQKLFTLYNALAKLSAIANNAADKSTASIMLGSLNAQFQKGLSEVLAYAQSIKADGLAVIPGAKASQVSAGISVPSSTLSQYTTKVVQNALPSDPMSGLNGTEQFVVSVTKGGVTKNINVDLSSLGTAQPSLDDVIGLVNQQLTANGEKTQLQRVRLNTKNADGTDISPPPQTWGIQINGVGTEKIAFSAPATGGTAVYLAGNSGAPNDLAGQVLKLDASGASPTVMTSARIEAQDPSTGSSSSTTAVASSTTTSTTTVTSDSTDSGVQAALTNINSILASSATSTTTAQQATSPATTVSASAIDSQGNSYVVGATAGSVNGDVLQGTQDAYLTKYDSTGAVVWQRMLGDTGATQANAVAVDANGNVVIAGKTNGDLTDGTTGNGGYNSFVTKYDSSGNEIFTRNVGPTADDGANAVTIGSDGSIYIGGDTNSSLAAGLTSGGGKDAYITKLSSTGKLVYNRQFGGAGDQSVTSLATDSSGNVVVVSMNQDGTASVSSFDSTDGTSAALWSQNLGDLGGGKASAVAVDGSNIYVGGWTNNSGIGGGAGQNTYSGATEGFVIGLSDTGTINTTTFVGTSSTDRVRAITAQNGEVYVAGDTAGDFGNGKVGSVDGFAAKVNIAGGSLDWVYQYSGREGQAQTYGIQVDKTGASVLDVLGLPKGTISYDQPLTITAQSTVRPGQEFFVAVNGGPKRPITIDKGETLNSLAIKLNTILLQDGAASVTYKPGGWGLTIKSKGTARIDISAGPAGNDALKGLGLPEGTIVNDTTTTATKPKVTDNYKSIFQDTPASTADAQPLYVGLNLTSILDITTKDGAASVTALIQNAMSNLRTAFRTLNPDPNLAALTGLSGNNFSSSGTGTVPDYLSSQLSNYQAGLQRLTGGSSSSTTTLV